MMMTKPLALVLLSLMVAAGACSTAAERAEPDPSVLHAAVDSLLEDSERAWNGGDLDRFVFWYKKSPETTFMGARGPRHGWDELRAGYAGRFEPGAARDSLRFENLETRPLGVGLGLATARYVLFQGDSITSTGIFTLVLEETSEGWRIVHDHSSESPD
jgi:beta-aspartyl-peptidase (threonine type)